MKLLLLFAALVAVAMGCQNPPKEGAIQVAGLAYHRGNYYRLKGGIAGSRSQKKLGACFKVQSKKYSGVHYVMFDFKQKFGYYAWGSSKDDAKCVKIPLTHAKHFRCLCPYSWPKHRVVANTTISSHKVPITVHCGRFRKGCAKVKMGAIIDDRCVPILIKKKYTVKGKCSGGALFFHNFHTPQDKYFAVPPVCKDAKMYKKCKKGKKMPSGGVKNKCPRPV